MALEKYSNYNSPSTGVRPPMPPGPKAAKKGQAMLTVTLTNGQKVYLALSAVAEIHETGPSSQWHGIRATIRTFDARVLEVRETAGEIVRAIQELL